MLVYEKYVKENSRLTKKQKNPDTELITCIIKTREDLITANNNYEFADGDLIDYYLYQIKATQAKYNYLLKKAKQSGLFVSMLDQIEIKSSDLAM